MTNVEETVIVAEQATYARTVLAALCETKSKFALAEALALDIPSFGSGGDRQSDAFKAGLPVVERLEGAPRDRRRGRKRSARGRPRTPSSRAAA